MVIRTNYFTRISKISKIELILSIKNSSFSELLQSLRILSQRTNPNNPNKFETLIFMFFSTRTIHRKRKRKLNELSKLVTSHAKRDTAFSQLSSEFRFECQLITGRKEISSRGYYISWHPHSTRRKSFKTVRHRALITLRLFKWIYLASLTDRIRSSKKKKIRRCQDESIFHDENFRIVLKGIRWRKHFIIGVSNLVSVSLYNRECEDWKSWNRKKESKGRSTFWSNLYCIFNIFQIYHENTREGFFFFCIKRSLFLRNEVDTILFAYASTMNPYRFIQNCVKCL